MTEASVSRGFRSVCLVQAVIRDQEVGGSNPLAPTFDANHFAKSTFGFLIHFQSGRFADKGGRKRAGLGQHHVNDVIHGRMAEPRLMIDFTRRTWKSDESSCDLFA
jgi:hypothetical protein